MGSRLSCLFAMCLALPGQSHEEMVSDVAAMARHDSAGRLTWLRASLMKSGGTLQIQEFVPIRGTPGKNLVATFGEGGPLTVIAAHYDSIRISPGANDNASGCIVLLHLARELARRPPSRTVVIAFLDQGCAGPEGLRGLLAGFGTQRVLCGLYLRCVGVGEHGIYGPQDPLPGNAGLRVLGAALAHTKTSGEGFQKIPPGPGRAFQDCGVDGVTLSFAPRSEAEALRGWLNWKRRPGKRRPPKPPFFARLRTPRDGPDTISGVGLARALSNTRTFVRLSLTDSAQGRLPRPGLPTLCRDFRKVVEAGGMALAAPKGTHIDLLTSVGPRAAFRTLISVAERNRGGIAAESICRLLKPLMIDEELRRGFAGVVDASLPPVLERLRRFWGQHASRLTWDPSVPGFRLADVEKDVK